MKQYGLGVSPSGVTAEPEGLSAGYRQERKGRKENFLQKSSLRPLLRDFATLRDTKKYFCKTTN
ncbi:hypothetical protein I8748_00345 [Nostoc sp. CENA67]|uniref:Uncharacterized protein n=1 Tax=Amazonocrinis nigriterrae CENA67 TaxID=2794033 RepID=A0A8J7L772_9NOST|nr:hypothetical protein [Amazonocrinis nigriterrae]MBH8560671.1 hypothetical protein [Amazonocrinis nigriterrae CENA67]